MTIKYVTFYGETFDTDKECILAEVNILEQYAMIYDCSWDIVPWEEILKKYWRSSAGVAFYFPKGIYLRILPQTNTAFNETYLASVRKYINQIFTDSVYRLDPNDIPTISGTYELTHKPIFKPTKNEEEDVNG